MGPELAFLLSGLHAYLILLSALVLRILVTVQETSGQHTARIDVYRAFAHMSSSSFLMWS